MTEKTFKRIDPLDDFDDYDEDEDTQENKYLAFQMDNEGYGIEIKYVVEIIGIQNITVIPDMPDYLRGVINLRGKVIPVMDARIRFSMSERQYDERTCIIIINVMNKNIGLIVDRVSEVIDIPETEIEPAPQVKTKEKSKFVKSMGKINDKVILILNADNLQIEVDIDKDE